MRSSLALLALLVAVSAMLPQAEAVTVRGYGTGALIGGDLTDPENNINDSVQTPPYYGVGYNWLQAFASNENYFTTSPPQGGRSEGALDLFDNKVGGGEAKYCCNGGTQLITVRLDGQYIITRFTIASDNDVGTQRDPDIWRILGSNDNVTFTPIFTYSNDGTSPFTLGGGSVELKVLQYDAGVDFPVQTVPYSYIRFEATSYGTGNVLGLSELEYFGTIAPEPATLTVMALGGLGLLLRRRRGR